MHAVDFQPAITHLPRSAETALKILIGDEAAALPVAGAQHRLRRFVKESP